MFLYYRLPLVVRPTFHHDLRASVLMGFRFGIVQLAALVASESLSAPSWQLAIITGAPIAGLALSVWWGKLAAAHRKMPLVVGPQIVANILLAMVFFVTGSLPFVLLCCLATLVFSASLPASSTIYRLNYPATHRATILGFIRARMLIVTALTAALAGAVLRGNELVPKYLGEGFGWARHLGPQSYRYLFPLAAVFGIASALRFARIRVRGEKTEPVKSPTPTFRAMARILRDDGDFRTFMISYIVAGFSTIMTMPMLLLVIKEDMAMPYDQASWIVVTIPGGLMALTSPLWGRILDKHNPILTRAWINLIWVLDPLLVFAAAATGHVIFLYAAKIVHGCMLAGGGIIWFLGVNFFARKEDVPLYQGIHMTLTGLRGAIAPFAAIAIARMSTSLGPDLGGPRYVFLIAAAGIFLASMINFRLATKLRAEGKLSSFASVEAETEDGESADPEADAD